MKDLIFDFNDYTEIVPIGDVCTKYALAVGTKAGTPISSAGAIANNGNAVAILAEDVPTLHSYPVKVIKKGFVDITAAEAACGLTYSSACKAALSNIRFVTPSTAFTAPELPSVSSSDNGKILRVAGGKWTKAAETEELPTAPTEAGEYSLKLTVSAEGVASYSWVSGE